MWPVSEWCLHYFSRWNLFKGLRLRTYFFHKAGLLDLWRMAKNAVYPLDPIGIRHAVRCQWCSRRHPTGAMFKRRGRHGHDVPKGWVGQRVPAQKGPFWASETCSVKHIALDCVYKQLYFTCVYILTLKVPIKKPKWMILHQHLVIFCHGWSRYQSL